MKNKFKVATFNLWKDCGEFPSRIEKIAPYLDKLDCICFQEDFHSERICSSDIINRDLNLIKTTMTLRKKSRNGVFSSSNLTTLSNFHPESVETIYFDKDGKDERGALVIETTIDDKKILVLNTHLTNLDHRRRMEQIYTIKDFLDNKKSDLIVLCGDMNSVPNSKELQCIKRHGFIDNNIDPTYEEGLILDYILSKANFSLKIKSKIVVENLSDHYCLKNKFIWK